MSAFEEREAISCLAAVLAAGVISPPTAALASLLTAASSNQLRDLDLPSSFYSDVLLLLSRAVALEVAESPLPQNLREVYSLCISVLSLPEASESETADLQARAIGLVRCIPSRMERVSEAYFKAQERAADAMAGVTMSSVTPDSQQPMQGSLLAPPDARSVGASSSASSERTPADRDILPRSAARPRGRAAGNIDAALDEMQLLRACLAWLHARFPGCRGHMVAGLRALLDRFASSPTKEHAAAVRCALQVIHACLRGQQLAAIVGAETDGMPAVNAEAAPFVNDWLTTLLPLHDTPGVINEMTPLLSVFHEQLVQCLFVACSPLLADRAASGTSVAACTRQVMLAISGAWTEARDGNSTKAVLLLHEVDQLLQFVVAASQRSDAAELPPLPPQPIQPPHPSAATGDKDKSSSSPVPLLLGLCMPLICEGIESDNSRLAQVALGLFKQSSLVDALFAPAAASPTPLQQVLAALARGGGLHWNATVNKLTHTVLRTLLSRDAAAVRRAFQCQLTAPDNASISAASAAAAALQRRSPPQGRLPSHTAASTNDGAAAYASAAAAVRTVVVGSGATALTFGGTGAAAAGVTHRLGRPGAVGGGGGWTKASGLPPPSTITGVAPWAVSALSAPSPSLPPSFAPRGGRGGGRHGGLPMQTTQRTGTAAQVKGQLASDDDTLLIPPESELQPQVAVATDALAVAPASVTAPAVSTAVGDDAAPTGPSSSGGGGVKQAQLEPQPQTQGEGGGDALDAYMRRLVPPEPPRAEPPPAASGGDAAAAADADPSLPAPTTPGLSTAPTLLPSLAFHDLVFGHELGAGAFSLVRFAKQIVRGAPGSLWPAHAVKIVSTRTLAAHGYEAAVRREMAVLSALAHPNVARLVSAFRWRDGAYLVLELARAGDLHSALCRLGSLHADAARALLGELCAALAHVHARGFAYGDVKPENVLLLEDAAGGCHVKLADFGAARPVSAAGRALVARSGRILADLRDGDWRAARGLCTAALDVGRAAAPGEPQQQPSSAAATVAPGSAGDGDAAVAAPGPPKDAIVGEAGEENAEEEEEDERLEGTVEYLSPELAARGAARPSVASDAYAFGVTAFQVLAGRLPEADLIWPPLPPAAGTSTRRQVRFGGQAAAAGSADAAAATAAAAAGSADAATTGGSGGGFPSGFPAAARDLVRGLLHPDPAQRLGGGPRGFAELAEHAWFAPLVAQPALQRLVATQAQAAADGGGGVSAASAALSLLYRLRGPTLATGVAAPVPDAAWSRRHNSTMWAPLPRSYLAADAAAGGAADAPDAGKGKAGQTCQVASSFTLRELLSLATLPDLPPS